MSAGINILRYGALGFGAFYGVSHQASIRSSDNASSVKREYDHKANQIAKAKDEFVKRTRPQESSTGNQVNQDPSDPKFDLEAYLKSVAAES